MAEIRDILGKATDTLKTKIPKMGTPIMGVVIVYMILIFALIATYFGVWCYKCYRGDIVMNDLLLIIREVTGASMIACVTFVAGCFVDLDHDGIPDKFEDKK